MAGSNSRPPHGKLPPGLKAPGGRRALDGGDQRADTARHADEVKAVARGADIVEATAAAEKRPPAFDRQELLVVRSWLQRRPLEPTQPATALVQYPRMWNTKRGRYCKFRAAGAGAYALLRARATF